MRCSVLKQELRNTEKLPRSSKHLEKTLYYEHLSSSPKTSYSETSRKQAPKIPGKVVTWEGWSLIRALKCSDFTEKKKLGQ